MMLFEIDSTFLIFFLSFARPPTLMSIAVENQQLNYGVVTYLMDSNYIIIQLSLRKYPVML